MLREYCEATNQRLNFTQELRPVYITMCVINGAMSVLSSSINLLVVISIKNSSALRAPSYTLLSLLAVSDLLVGLVVQPLYIARKVADLKGDNSGYCFLSLAYNSMSSFAGALSYLSIAAISCDRLLAVRLSTNYRAAVTRKAIRAAVCVMVALSLLYALTYTLSFILFFIGTLVVLPLCLAVVCFNYVKINGILRQRQKNIQRTNSKFSSCSHRTNRRLNKTREIHEYRHVQRTVLFVLLVFLMCYLPYFCFMVVRQCLSARVALYSVNEITITIVYMNSVLNPSLYISRMAEIRRAVKKTLNVVRSLICK